MSWTTCQSPIYCLMSRLPFVKDGEGHRRHSELRDSNILREAQKCVVKGTGVDQRLSPGLGRVSSDLCRVALGM